MYRYLIAIVLLFISSNFTFSQTRYFSNLDTAKIYKEDVTYLSLIHENIEVMPDFSMFPNLKELHLRGNKIKVIPSSFKQNEKIESLSLGEMPQLDWDGAFKIIKDLPKLEELDLEMCGLQFLPKSILKKKTMKIIFLGGNKFSKKYLRKLKKEFPNISFEM